MTGCACTPMGNDKKSGRKSVKAGPRTGVVRPQPKGEARSRAGRPQGSSLEGWAGGA